ncbi:MAG: NACHT domain-containing protein [Methylocella sp.]
MFLHNRTKMFSRETFLFLRVSAQGLINLVGFRFQGATFMSDVPLEADKPGALDKVWDFLGTANFYSATGILKWIIIFAVCSIALLWAGGKLLEGFAKALEAYKNSGLPLTFRREKRVQVRRRKQFCNVLNGDLLTLAKSENWNDQYFTDLEAEVEAEGGYYPTLLHKMLGRQSRGLRRVSSLISAIELSTEQALLVVGQPGSGKSAALRHLGHQFAKRGIRSADPKTIIPLYVNLKELGLTPEGGVNADFIKQFVVDNIRRGDADTAAYLNQHWDEYRARGIWFFLFDSFDEIPAVLHAPTESTVIRQYAEAIRQFLEGMSSCRGVLASRECKGPNTLPWQKIRILPLSEERQENLVENSFLEPKLKAIVSQHMVSSSSSLRDNPLFLTLLCRYVRDHHCPPINDHDLLSGHIDRLAWRDEDYIRRKYNLAPDELIAGAIQIAILFAERPSLSLAPTQSEIASEIQGNSVPEGNLENMFGALVDVKIGRSDVREARAGDRRFTFSHRRYQETLFVRHLARNRHYRSPRELLTDTKWREYSVTLLQTQQLAAIEPLFTEATTLLAEYAMCAARVQTMQEFGGHLAYYDWQTDPAVPLLTMLQEGLARRLSEVPRSLSIQIEQLLRPRWIDGDAYDQTMVLRHGGLLPQPVLEEYLAYAVNHGSDDLEDIAYQRVEFLNDISPKLADWVRDRLSTEAIRTYKQVDVLRLEALSARLPSSVGAIFILRRCQTCNKLRRPFESLYEPFMLPSDFFVKILGKSLGRKYSRRRGTLANIILELIMPVYLLGMFLMLFTISRFSKSIVCETPDGKYHLPPVFSVMDEPIHLEPSEMNLMLSQMGLLLSRHIYLFSGIGLAYVGAAAAILTLYTQRSIGCRLNMPYLLRRIHGTSRSTLRQMGFSKATMKVAVGLLLIPLVTLAPGAVVIGVMMLFGYRNLDWEFLARDSFLSFLITGIGLSIGVFVNQHYVNRRFLAHLRALTRQGLSPSWVVQAQSVE